MQPAARPLVLRPLARRLSTPSRKLPHIFAYNLKRKDTADVVRKACGHVGHRFRIAEAAPRGARLRFEAVTSRGVADVDYAVDEATGLAKGFAFITLVDASDCDAAVQLINGKHPGDAKAMRARVQTHQPASSPVALNNKHILACTTADALLMFFRTKAGSFNSVNLATALHKLGSLRTAPQADAEVTHDDAVLDGALQDGAERYEALLGRATTSVRDNPKYWDGRHLANAVWGAAKLGQCAPELFKAVALEAVSKVESCSAQNLSNLVWAFAKTGNASAPLFDAIAADAVAKVDTFTAQELAITVWAFAKAGYADDAGAATAKSVAKSLYDAVAARAAPLLSGFNTHELATLAWAFAKAGATKPQDKELFDALALEATSRVEQFNAQQLANIAWAFAKAGGRTPARLFEALAVQMQEKIATSDLRRRDDGSKAGMMMPESRRKWSQSGLYRQMQRRRLGRFNSQELANTVWAFAKVDYKDQSLFDAVATEALKKVAQFNAQELANTVWAYSKAGVDAYALYDAFAFEARFKIISFTPVALSTMVWAYARQRIRAPSLFDAVKRDAEIKVDRFNATELATTLWAFSTAEIDAPELYECFLEPAEKKMKSFNPHELASLVWAYSMAGSGSRTCVGSQTAVGITTWAPVLSTRRMRTGTADGAAATAPTSTA
ncbi:hypothetical protein M885DRAFT_244102 [Pelagophyceae sp. CCMP2097]|nr:hypothetical protein M885DRAFT_244102 [Pelagophyceae sp. CCMP2097]